MHGSGGYDEAEALLREALEIDPLDATAWANLGLCLGRLGREKESAACFTRVRELSGGNVRDIVR